MKYGKIGSSEFQKGGVKPNNQEWIEMLEDKPTEGDWIAHKDGFWVENIPTLAEIKELKKAEINQARDAQEQAGFVFDGSTFDSDMTSYNRLVGANLSAQIALASGQPFSFDWTLQDNTTRTLTAEEMVKIIPVFAQYSNTLHIKATELKNQINLAQRKEDVEKIVW